WALHNKRAARGPGTVAKWRSSRFRCPKSLDIEGLRNVASSPTTTRSGELARRALPVQSPRCPGKGGWRRHWPARDGWGGYRTQVPTHKRGKVSETPWQVGTLPPERRHKEIVYQGVISTVPSVPKPARLAR